MNSQRIRQKKVKLLGEQVRVLIPLYPDSPVSVAQLQSNPVEAYKKLREFNHVLIHFGKLLDKVKNGEFDSERIEVTLPQERADIDELAISASVLSKQLHYGEKINKKLAITYKKVLLALAKRVNDAFRKKTDFSYTFVPLKGGAYVISAFNVPLDSMIAIDCKRIPLEDGTFAFGMNSPVFDPYDLDRLSGKSLRVVEVCIASGITSVGILLDLFSKSCLPKEVVFQALFASDFGLRFIKATARVLGVEVSFVVGKVYKGLGNLVSSHDSIINESGEPVLGDATSILSSIAGLQR